MNIIFRSAVIIGFLKGIQSAVRECGDESFVDHLAGEACIYDIDEIYGAQDDKIFCLRDVYQGYQSEMIMEIHNQHHIFCFRTRHEIQESIGHNDIPPDLRSFGYADSATDEPRFSDCESYP